MRFIVLGATGRTGLHVTRQALERGHAVTAFVRSPARMPLQHQRLDVVCGNPTDSTHLRRMVAGKDAVLSALGVTSRHGSGILESAARSTIRAMDRTNVQRLIVVSQALLYHDIGFFAPLLRYFLSHHVRDSEAMERLVAGSQLDWTILRPSMLTDNIGVGRYRVSEGHSPPGFSIARADLARAMIDVVEQGTYVRKTIGLSK